MKTSNTKKICVVTNSFPRYEGDYAGSIIYDLVNKLSSKYEMHAIYLDYPAHGRDGISSGELFSRHPVRYPYRTYPLSQVHGLKTLGFAPLFMDMLMKIREVVREHSINLIHAHWAVPSGFLASLCCGKVPLLTTLEGVDVNIYGQKRWVKPLIRHALVRSARTIAISNDLKTEVVKLGAESDKIVVIPDGVDINKFKPMSKETSRLKLGLPDDFLIVFVGSLFRVKRLDRLIRIGARLAHDFRFHIVIVGDGPERSNLENLARQLELGNVIFAGNMSHKEVSLYMAASDVLVLPSESEGLPTCVQEAMACGIPVVASNVGGLPDLITNGINGYLTDSEAEMEERLRLMMSSPDSTAAMGASALEFARQNLSLDRIAKQIEGLYHSILSKKS